MEKRFLRHVENSKLKEETNHKCLRFLVYLHVVHLFFLTLSQRKGSSPQLTFCLWSGFHALLLPLESFFINYAPVSPNFSFLFTDSFLSKYVLKFLPS